MKIKRLALHISLKRYGCTEEWMAIFANLYDRMPKISKFFGKKTVQSELRDVHEAEAWPPNNTFPPGIRQRDWFQRVLLLEEKDVAVYEKLSGGKRDSVPRCPMGVSREVDFYISTKYLLYLLIA